MRLILHRAIPADDDFRLRWNELVQAMERPQVFYTCEWAVAVTRAYAASVESIIFAGYRAHRLAAVAALTLESGGSRAVFLTAATADYCDFISAPADRGEFVRRLMAELRRMGVAQVRFANLPAESSSAKALKSISRESGFSVFARPAYSCAQVSLNSAGERKQAAESAARKLKRMSKAVGELRQAVASHEVSPDEFDREFSAFANAHVARFLSTDQLSNLVRPERRAFLAELAQLLSQQGWLALSTLKVDGQTVAWNYGFRFGGNWFYYQPTFDSDAHRLSAGSFLLCKILEAASQDPEIQTLDLGLGEEEYKQQYANRTQETLYITASQSSARHAREACRYQGARWIAKYPRLESHVRRQFSRLRALRSAGKSRGRSGIAGFLWSRLTRGAGEAKELTFFECLSAPSQRTGERIQLSLQPVSLKLLADTAMRHADDPATLEYLLRSAARLRSGTAEGFALISGTGAAVEFCWVAQFDGFKLPDLDEFLREPAPGAMLLFDRHAPKSFRGNEYEGECAALVAERLLESGKKPWILRRGGHISDEIARANFVPRFSILRKRRWLSNQVSTMEFISQGEQALNLNPAA